jgi:hypothetical protein
MKTKMVLTNALAGLIAISSLQAAEAQDSTATTATNLTMPVRSEAQLNAESASPSAYYASDAAGSLKTMQQPGTGDLQEKVLMKINQQLAQGSLSPAQASALKTQLNHINATESWYKSFGTAIPKAVLDNNNQSLTEMSASITHKQQISLASENALHEDVDQLISRNLATNHISSSQAEKYYLRLAEIESNLETAKNSGLTAQQTSIMNSSLTQMKSELSIKSH